MSDSTTPSADAKAPKKSRINRRQLITGAIVLLIICAVGSVWYYTNASKYVFTDKADVEAPLINLGSQSAGTLRDVYVDQGDWIPAHKAVARVGDDMIVTRVPGIAVTVKKDIGAEYQAGSPVVSMIEPKELRVVARIDEDKGLKDIYVGQTAYFTVDAYGSKKFEGTVESISETSRTGDVVFNISDKREEKQFDVKIRFDTDEYTSLNNGMSARVWIVK